MGVVTEAQMLIFLVLVVITYKHTPPANSDLVRVEIPVSIFFNAVFSASARKEGL
jgi:hypothetical protein